MHPRALAGAAVCALSIVAVSITAAPRVAQAQVTTFTTFDDFAAAVGGRGVDSFATLPLGFLESPIERTAGMYQYTISAPEGLFGLEIGDNRVVSTNTADDALRLTAFTSTVRGVGGTFFVTDFNGAPTSGDLRITWTVTGARAGTTTIANASTASFFGILSTGVITSFVVTAVQPALGDFIFPTADNIVLGTARAGSTVVPEPGTAVLTAIGVFLLLVASRRRTAVTADCGLGLPLQSWNATAVVDCHCGRG